MARILHRGNTDDGFMRGEGRIRVEQDPFQLENQLLRIEKIGRICYRSDKKKITSESADTFIRSLISRGHESVIEHSSLTVIFSNVSRGFTHEMVRYRLCAFSQESTRYVDYADSMMDLEEAELVIIFPPHRDINYSGDADGLSSGHTLAYRQEEEYKYLRRAGWKPQDARQFLPIGIASKIAVTANFREWRHIMKMRTQKAAHWEIKYMMCDLLVELKKIIPVIFEDFVFASKPDRNGYMYTLGTIGKIMEK